MATCETRIIAHDEEPTWASEITYCIEKIEKTGDREVEVTFSHENSVEGEYGYYPCIEHTVSLTGPVNVEKVVDVGCGLDPHNNDPYKVKFTGLDYGDYECCLGMSEYEL